MLEAVGRVVDSERFLDGPFVADFESRFARWLDTPQAVAVDNGTDAIELALRALRIGPGDEVIVPAMTFVATIEAVIHAGATPVLADVEEATGAIDAEAAAATCGPRTAAVIAVHLYGSMADLPALRRLCRERGLALVEDAAQAHGATLDGRTAGTWGDAGCFSFYPSKNLGAFGDGGAVVTPHADVAERVRGLREHGGRGAHAMPGRTSRMDEIQAAALGVMLEAIDGWTDARRAAADRYRKTLETRLTCLAARGEAVYHLFGVLVPRRDDVAAALARAGVATGVHYARALHEWPAYEGLARPGSLPCAERLGREELSLPMFPGLRDDEIDHVTSVLLREAG